ncbi:MAG: matrixin family metalloprotease [Thermoproteota archaeon]
MGKILVLALLLVICPSMAFAEEIETKAYLPWDLDSQKTIHVLINSESEITDGKKIIIDEVIMSEKSVMLDNQKYFEGWQGALDQIHYSDNIQIRLVFTDNEKSPNTILINLVDESSEFDGFTKFDLNKNKIVKSHITIYNSKDLNDTDFEKIMRHEFGHSLGLAHSKNINDIMFPVIGQTNPYITQDNISSLSLLYG